MAPIVLYAMEGSPPVRAVLSIIKALRLNVERRDINLFEHEQLQPEYLKINPQHTVPTINDNGFIIWDSHAIMIYLIEKYAKNDFLYPKELKKRAVVHQRMFFDSGILFPAVHSLFYPLTILEKESVPKEVMVTIAEAYGFLEAFLSTSAWLACDHVTIADISAAVCVDALNGLIPLNPATHPRTIKWLKNCGKLPYYEGVNSVMQEAFDYLKKFVDASKL